MKIILSPAKKMREDIAYLAAQGEPPLIAKSERLLAYLRTLSLPALQKLLACSDALAKLNHERYADMDLHRRQSAALLSYDGIQYQYMAPQVFEDAHFAYVQQHVRILSGFYGILRPLDGVVPYRLEMQAKLKTDFCGSLYDFWGSDIYDALAKEDTLILDLASSEYSRCVRAYQKDPVRIVRCVFAEIGADRVLREKGVYVKMARGEMVRYLAEGQIETLEGVKGFDRLRFRYDAFRSDENTLVFSREEEKTCCRKKR